MEDVRTGAFAMVERRRMWLRLVPVALILLAALALVAHSAAGYAEGFRAAAAVAAALALTICVGRIKLRSLRENAQGLAWSEERYRMLAEASDEVFFELNLRDGSLLVSHNFARVFGRPPARSFAEFLEALHPEDRERYEPVWRAIASGAEGAHMVADIRLLGGAGDPTRCTWCRIRLRALEDGRGRRRTVIGKLADISQERLNCERLERKARTDQLTGLLNRAGLEENIRRRLADRRRRPCAIAILDVDDFKRVNDFYGHDAGDRALRALSDLLRAHFRETDFVGRFGGDEFMALIDGVDSPEKLEQALARLREALEGLCVPGVRRPLTATVGAALYPSAGDSFEALYKRADSALYEAKRRSRGGFALCDGRLRRIESPNISA